MEIKDARIDGGNPFDWGARQRITPGIEIFIPRNFTVRSWIAA